MLKLATKLPPEQLALERAWKSGFRFAEFWLSSELLEQVEEIIRRAEVFPLQYVPHFPNKKVEQETISQAVHLYQALNCRTMILHQPMIDRWGKELKAIASDINVAVENHRLSEKEFWNWAERNPGLNLDIEHLWKFTLKDAPLSKLEKVLDKFLKLHSAKLNHIHLPGYIPKGAEHRPMYCSRDLMLTVWPRLEAIGYQGFVVSEVDAEFQTEQDLKMDLLLFERWRQSIDEKRNAESQ